MKELHINLTVTALTLVVVCGIGALAETLGKSLYQPGKERFAFEYKTPASVAPVALKVADVKKETAVAPDKAAIN
jgi:hypothetical protein